VHVRPRRLGGAGAALVLPRGHAGVSRPVAPAQDAEFVLSHADNIQATGFLEHIKLPHYVDFQSELELVRKLRREARGETGREAAE